MVRGGVGKLARFRNGDLGTATPVERLRTGNVGLQEEGMEFPRESQRDGFRDGDREEVIPMNTPGRPMDGEGKLIHRCRVGSERAPGGFMGVKRKGGGR